MALDNNRIQSISINRLILIIDDENFCDKLFIIIDYQYQSMGINQLT